MKPARLASVATLTSLLALTALAATACDPQSMQGSAGTGSQLNGDFERPLEGTWSVISGDAQIAGRPGSEIEGINALRISLVSCSTVTTARVVSQIEHPIPATACGLRFKYMSKTQAPLTIQAIDASGRAVLSVVAAPTSGWETQVLTLKPSERPTQGTLVRWSIALGDAQERASCNLDSPAPTEAWVDEIEWISEARFCEE